jgi:hypothetical protein
MHSLGVKVHAGAVAFFQNPFHPQGEAWFFSHVFRCGWGYHEIFGGRGMTNHFRR